jgi:hypothetical protein
MCLQVSSMSPRKKKRNRPASQKKKPQGMIGAPETKTKTAMQLAMEAATANLQEKDSTNNRDYRHKAKSAEPEISTSGIKKISNSKVTVTRTKPSQEKKPQPTIKRRAAPPARTPSPRRVRSLEVNDKTIINERFVSKEKRSKYIKPNGGMIWPQEGGELDLVIGLDFGTAYTKVVVQEPAGEFAWAIPFTDNLLNPYLLPSMVIERDGAFSLDGDGEIHSALKLPLLLKSPPREHALKVVSFLALVIRHVCSWVDENKKAELRGLAPLWSIHLGLPAENLEDNQLVHSFKTVLMASALLAITRNSKITTGKAKVALGSAHSGLQVKNGNLPIHADQVGVLPEVAAQIFGYVRSDAWDHNRPQFMLVDIGGGTVDAAIFNVTKQDSEHRFSFFKSTVLPLGSTLLHRDRLRWLIDQLEGKPRQDLIEGLGELLASFNLIESIPDNIDEYLENADFIPDTVDKRFQEGYETALWRDINFVRTKINPEREQWKNFPFLLTGGARDVDIYKKFIAQVRRAKNYHVDLQEIEMRKPENLESPGLSSADYHRISVAYGLSFLNLGKILTPENVKDLYWGMSPEKDDGASSDWRFDR